MIVPQTIRLSLEQTDDYFMSWRWALRTSKPKNLEIPRGEFFRDDVHDKQKLAKLQVVQNHIDFNESRIILPGGRYLKLEIRILFLEPSLQIKGEQQHSICDSQVCLISSSF